MNFTSNPRNALYSAQHKKKFFCWEKSNVIKHMGKQALTSLLMGIYTVQPMCEATWQYLRDPANLPSVIPLQEAYMSLHFFVVQSCRSSRSTTLGMDEPNGVLGSTYPAIRSNELNEHKATC